MSLAFILVLQAIVFAAVDGQTVQPCLMTQAECSNVMTDVSILNRQLYCCPPGFVMSLVAGQCQCTQTSFVEPCGTGPKACLHWMSSSFSTDAMGNTRCCKHGWAMQASSGFYQGHYLTSCLCQLPIAPSSQETGLATELGTAFTELAQLYRQSLHALANSFHI